MSSTVISTNTLICIIDVNIHRIFNITNIHMAHCLLQAKIDHIKLFGGGRPHREGHRRRRGARGARIVRATAAAMSPRAVHRGSAGGGMINLGGVTSTCKTEAEHTKQRPNIFKKPPTIKYGIPIHIYGKIYMLFILIITH